MTSHTPDRAVAQAAFDAASFTMPVTSHFAGRPPCPACMTGHLEMLKTAMAYHSEGSYEHGYRNEDGSGSYPVEPTGCYMLRVMTCRLPDLGRGCGFAVPLERPTFMLAGPEGIAVFRDPV